MTLETPLTAADAAAIGKMINGFGVLGSQLFVRQRPDFYQRATDLLKRCRNDYVELLRKLDEQARSQKDESPVRLIEDIDTHSGDALGYLNTARRCLLVCAFLGHCIAKSNTFPATAQVTQRENTLH